MLGRVSRASTGAWRRRAAAAGAATALVAVSLVAGPSGAGANGETAPASVDSEVYAALTETGSSEFFVYLTESADLSAAASLDSKAAKGALVYRELTRHAELTQAPLRAFLEQREVAYTPFWIANALLVTGDRALVDALAARPDVARIEANGQVPLLEGGGGSSQRQPEHTGPARVVGRGA